MSLLGNTATSIFAPLSYDYPQKLLNFRSYSCTCLKSVPASHTFESTCPLAALGSLCSSSFHLQRLWLRLSLSLLSWLWGRPDPLYARHQNWFITGSLCFRLNLQKSSQVPWCPVCPVTLHKACKTHDLIAGIEIEYYWTGRR